MDSRLLNDPSISAIAGSRHEGRIPSRSRAQMQFLPRLSEKEFSVRPGPIQGNMVNPLVKRVPGTRTVSYPQPLKRTCGVILFQEQALRVLMEVADFSAEEAEEACRGNDT